MAMLFPRQWSRILGGVLAAAVFLFLLLESREYIPHAKIRLAASPPGTEPARKAESAKNADTDIPAPARAHQARPSNFGLPGSHAKPQKPTAVSNLFPVRSTTTEPDATFRKAVVVGKMSSDDTAWIKQDLPDWESSIYVVDLPAGVKSPTGLKTKHNKANEAIPYLTYIIEHYNDLPDVAAFVHSSGISWHNDAPYWNVANMLLWLNLSTVEQRGFVNLRCQGHPGCPNEIQLNRSSADETLTVENTYPYVFGEFFNMTVSDVRQKFPIIATPCCAQFAVSGAQILRRPKGEYERWLRLIEQSDFESHVLGTVMEYMWHIIFGQDAVHCEQEWDCRAALYGWGDPGDWPESPLPSNFGFGAVGPPGLPAL